MSHGAQQLAGAGVSRVGAEQIPNSLEPNRHVVAVIAITQDRVQPGQVVTVTVDPRGTALEKCAHVCSSDGRRSGRRDRRKRLGLRTGWQDGASVATLRSTGNALRVFQSAS